MNTLKPIALSCALMATLSACGGPIRDTVTRLDTTQSFAAQADRIELQDQADALNRMARDLERRSTIKGAATGGLVGCGLGIVTGSNAQKCVTGAAVGGLVGAGIGRAAGKRDVEKRVELVSANALVRSIRGMTTRMDAITLSLPELLREQNEELLDLEARRDAGAITDQDYADGVAAIRLSRADLAQTLSASAQTAQRARENMMEAAAQGQTGLEWHVLATGGLAREAQSARSQIDLL